LIFVSALIAVFESLPALLNKLVISSPAALSQSVVQPRIPLASGFTLIIDMAVLVIVYQSVSNWRSRFPSRFASGIALLAALWSDAIIFPFLAYYGTSLLFSQISVNLIGKSLAGLALWPLVSIYLFKYSPDYPNSAATIERPVLDIFTTRLQLEKRASLLYNLLHITNQINQLIARSTSTNELFQQACQLLTQDNAYPLAWIGMCAGSQGQVTPVARAGAKSGLLDEIAPCLGSCATPGSPEPGTCIIAMRTARAAIHHNSSIEAGKTNGNQPVNRTPSFRVSASFPMRHSGQVFGVLNVYSQQREALSQDEEVSLFQQLADDLAFAANSLEARRQQASLNIATETMRDGLLITDTHGKILYANPAIAEMLDCNLGDILGQTIFTFMPSGEAARIREQLYPALLEERQLKSDTELILKNGGSLFVEATAGIAQNDAGQPENVVINVRDVSQRQFAEAIVQATEALNSSLDLDQVLDQILAQTMRVVPCQSVNLMLIEGDHASVVRQIQRIANDRLEKIAGGTVLPLSTPTLEKMLVSGLPFLIKDTRQEHDWKTLETSAWIRSFASAPLQIRQQVIGFLSVNSNQPNFFSEESTRRLQAFASHAAAALHNARLYRDLQKYSFELEDRVQERTAELSIAKNRIEVILASVPDAVFVLESDEKLLDSNQAGKFLLEKAKLQHTDLFGQEFMRRLRSGKLPDEKAIVEVDGRIYQALSSSLPLPDQETGLVVVFRDVTRFQELDTMKTQFVSDVSHELRTPLANLSLFLDLLSNERNELKRERYQATLRRETDRLTLLIEDLLTISRLESNRINFFIKEVDILALLKDLAEDRTPMALQHKLKLEFVPPEELPLALVDPRLITQVISNILTNALNYTQPGGLITLTANTAQAEGKKWVTILVSDTGEGVLPEELPFIFERFYRGSASRKTKAPGTGLGLAISQEILGRMGGKISVVSEPGHGSTFTIWIPARL
jgi:PAS domain S-box-containing protein